MTTFLLKANSPKRSVIVSVVVFGLSTASQAWERPASRLTLQESLTGWAIQSCSQPSKWVSARISMKNSNLPESEARNNASSSWMKFQSQTLTATFPSNEALMWCSSIPSSTSRTSSRRRRKKSYICAKSTVPRSSYSSVTLKVRRWKAKRRI